VVKTDPARAAEILGTATQIMAALGVVFEPFLPFSAAKIRAMLGMELADWSLLAGTSLVPAGQPLAEPALLFEKIEDEAMDAQRAKLVKPVETPVQPVETPAIPAIAANIDYDQFAGLDLRVATILEATKVPKADRLLQLTLDTGVDRRTVLSGIAEHFAPEEVIGRQVVLLANLAPRTIRGVESQGMILMAENPETGKLEFLQPGAALPAGATIR